MVHISQRMKLVGLGLATYITSSAAQTYTSCNPVEETDCPADTALGKTISIDFTQGASSEFTASGKPTYGSKGVEFTVKEQGDAPTLTSNWYIMFGSVEYTIQTAPGTGIVSAAVLQSDDLDEIDWEWLGGYNQAGQTNFFGKGNSSYPNRWSWNDSPDNHDEFHTYSIDWTAESITWGVDGTPLRTLYAKDIDSDEFPQTPMMIKVGNWAGGDPSNAKGTIEWAGGETDYSKGPFTMYLKSLKVTDYSTGTKYSYSDTSGTWKSIESTGGEIDSGSSESSNYGPTTVDTITPTGTSTSQHSKATSLSSSKTSSGTAAESTTLSQAQFYATTSSTGLASSTTNTSRATTMATSGITSAATSAAASVTTSASASASTSAAASSSGTAFTGGAGSRTVTLPLLICSAITYLFTTLLL